MTLREEEKRALRRLQVDKVLSQRELAREIGISNNTLINAVKHGKPIHPGTYRKIMLAISKAI